MKRGRKTLAFVLSTMALGNGAQALIPESTGGSYQGIVARNVFDVHPPVPHDPALDRPPIPPPPNIRLQGITDILHRKQVIFKVQLPPKPPAPAKEESYIMTEGQREGEIEVLEIDVKAGTVKMNDYGVITNLSIELNGEKLASGPPAGAPAPAPAAQLPAPGAFVPPTLPAGRMPPRTLRLPGSAAAQQNTANSVNSGYLGTQEAAGDTMFSGGTRASATAKVPGEQRGLDLMTPEQVLLIEAQREQMKQSGDPFVNMLPPTPVRPHNISPAPQ